MALFAPPVAKMASPCSEDLSTGSHLYQLEAGEVIHSLTFFSNRYWLCAATEVCIRIWDLESKKAIAELAPPRRPMNRKALKV